MEGNYSAIEVHVAIMMSYFKLTKVLFFLKKNIYGYSGGKKKGNKYSTLLGKQISHLNILPLTQDMLDTTEPLIGQSNVFLNPGKKS